MRHELDTLTREALVRAERQALLRLVRRRTVTKEQIGLALLEMEGRVVDLRRPPRPEAS
jgi:hypothetical protein